MCILFQRDQSVITRHIKNAFEEGEVDVPNNMQILHNIRRGRPLTLYNLDVIISVGYRMWGTTIEPPWSGLGMGTTNHCEALIL